MGGFFLQNIKTGNEEITMTNDALDALRKDINEIDSELLIL